MAIPGFAAWAALREANTAADTFQQQGPSDQQDDDNDIAEAEAQASEWAYHPPPPVVSRCDPGRGTFYEVICNQVFIHAEPCVRSQRLAHRDRGQVLELFQFDPTRCWGRVQAATGRAALECATEEPADIHTCRKENSQSLLASSSSGEQTTRAASGWVLVNDDALGPLLRACAPLQYRQAAGHRPPKSLPEPRTPASQQHQLQDVCPPTSVEAPQWPKRHLFDLDPAMLFEVVYEAIFVRREPSMEASALSRRLRGQLLQLLCCDGTGRWGKVELKTSQGVHFGWVLLEHERLGPLLRPFQPADGEDLFAALGRKLAQGQWVGV